MSKPIIVDTSVWINFFRGIDSREVRILTKYLENDWVIYLCPTIVQEILQGITNDNQFEEVKEYLLAFNILSDDPIEMAIEAANLYRLARKKGKTVRKSNDCLIAQYAVRYKLEVLHRDRDFDLIPGN